MDEDFTRTLLELERRFSSEQACAEYLAALRWPGGWVCPRCAAPMRGRSGAIADFAIIDDMKCR